MALLEGDQPLAKKAAPEFSPRIVSGEKGAALSRPRPSPLKYASPTPNAFIPGIPD